MYCKVFICHCCYSLIHLIIVHLILIIKWNLYCFYILFYTHLSTADHCFFSPKLSHVFVIRIGQLKPLPTCLLVDLWHSGKLFGEPIILHIVDISKLDELFSSDAVHNTRRSKSVPNYIISFSCNMVFLQMCLGSPFSSYTSLWTLCWCPKPHFPQVWVHYMSIPSRPLRVLVTARLLLILLPIWSKLFPSLLNITSIYFVLTTPLSSYPSSIGR